MWKRGVEVGVAAGVPTLIWGAPGIGKTSYVYQLGQCLDLHTEVVIASLREPSDFLGLPIVQDDHVNMAPPAWAKRLKEKGKGLLVFDEITTAPPAVQAALLRVVLERVVGDISLPKGVRILAIANPADEAGGWNLSLPLANRFLHIQAEAQAPEKWATSLMEGWQDNVITPHFQEDNLIKAKGLIGGFLTHRGSELLIKKPKEGNEEINAWPSPRTWEMAATLLGFGLHYGLDIQMMLLNGTVGKGASVEFFKWTKELDLPDPAETLADPSKFKVPVRSDQAFAALHSIIGYATNQLKKDPKNEDPWKASWEIIGITCDAGQPDVAVPSARILAKYKKPEYSRPKGLKALAPILEV